MTFRDVLSEYRKISFSERDKGTKFERLMQAYLQTDPKYAYKFKRVWMWNDFPGRNDLGGSDTGIDLVALTNEGDYWAIQCKCFQEDAYIDKPAIDSFIATSSRQFKDENLQTTKFAHRLWISTSNKWTNNATETIHNQHPPFSRINLYDLQEAPVDWEKLEQGLSGELSRTAKKTLRPHQKEALEKAHEYFKTAERGKLIMACGTGKTFNSLRIAENETNGNFLSRRKRRDLQNAFSRLSVAAPQSMPAAFEPTPEGRLSPALIPLPTPAGQEPQPAPLPARRLSLSLLNRLS